MLTNSHGLVETLQVVYIYAWEIYLELMMFLRYIQESVFINDQHDLFAAGWTMVRWWFYRKLCSCFLKLAASLCQTCRNKMKYIGIETFHSHVSYIYREIKHKEWCKNIIYSLCSKL